MMFFCKLSKKIRLLSNEEIQETAKCLVGFNSYVKVERRYTKVAIYFKHQKAVPEEFIKSIGEDLYRGVSCKNSLSSFYGYSERTFSTTILHQENVNTPYFMMNFKSLKSNYILDDLRIHLKEEKVIEYGFILSDITDKVYLKLIS